MRCCLNSVRVGSSRGLHRLQDLGSKILKARFTYMGCPQICWARFGSRLYRGTSHLGVPKWASNFGIYPYICICIKLLLGHKSLPPSWKLTVYRSVVQSILLYAMESAQLTPPQLTRIDHVHFKAIRRIFGIKSSFYHRVLNPTAEECSNQYLTGLAYIPVE